MTQKASYSGKFVLRISPKVHQQLILAAEALGKSLNQICVEKIMGSIEQEKLGSGKAGNETSRIVSAFEKSGISLIGLVLFGSVSRGENRESSDTDLLLVVPRKFPLARNLYQKWDLFMGANTISPHFVHMPSDPLEAGSIWFECALDGIILHEVDFSISHFFGKIRTLFATGQIQRAVSHGHGYWIKYAK